VASAESHARVARWFAAFLKGAPWEVARRGPARLLAREWPGQSLKIEKVMVPVGGKRR
jgi:hypothetical protein